MATELKTVEQLAVANLKKGDEAKGVERIAREVKKNKANWRISLTAQDELVDNCQDAVDALKGDTSASAAEVTAANEDLKITTVDFKTMKSTYAVRFGEEINL